MKRRESVFVALVLVTCLLVPRGVAAQCDNCPRPRIYVAVRHTASGTQPVPMEMLKAMLESMALRAFRDDCADMSGQAEITEVLSEAAEAAQERLARDSTDTTPSEVEVELIGHAAALADADYALVLRTTLMRFEETGRAMLVVNAALFRSRGAWVLYERQTASLRSDVGPDTNLLALLEGMITEVADEFGSLIELIQRKETPVTASLTFEPKAISVGGTDVGRIQFRDVLNVEGAPITDYLWNETKLTVRFPDPESRWNFMLPPTIDGWFGVGIGEIRSGAPLTAPESCEPGEPHPLLAEVEVAPACWRQQVIPNGEAVARVTVRGLCQLQVAVTPDGAEVEEGASVGAGATVLDHTGRSLDHPVAVRVAADRLRLGAATPTQGVVTGDPFRFTYTAGESRGSERVAVYAASEDEWGTRRGEGGMTVEVGGIGGLYRLARADGQSLPAAYFDDPEAEPPLAKATGGTLELVPEKYEELDGHARFTIDVVIYDTDGSTESDVIECIGSYRRVGETLELFCAYDESTDWLGVWYSGTVSHYGRIDGSRITLEIDETGEMDRFEFVRTGSAPGGGE